MTKAAELAKMGEVLTNSQIGGRRNIILNGSFQIAQRGTSFTGVGNGDNAYYLDRFQYVESGSPEGVFTITQATDTPDGFANSMKLDCTTAESALAANERVRIRQRIEGQNLQQLKKGTSSAEKLTLSFHVKSTVTGTAIVNLYDADNNRHISKSYTVSSADTWEKKIITFEGDTTGALDNDNASSLELMFYIQAGSNFTSGTLATSWASHSDANDAAGQTINAASSTSNNFLLTGIQLEVGSQATPFEHRSFGEELQLCKRYLSQVSEASDNTPVHLVGYNQAGGACRYSLHTEMRAAPTVTITNMVILHGSGTETSISSVDNIKSQGSIVSFRANPSASVTAGDAVAFYTSGTDASIRLDAEL